MDSSPIRSVWTAHWSLESGALAEDVRADVCVIGAGIAGLSAAYMLMKKGRRVVVVDEGPVGCGMAARTTAHLVSAIHDRYHEVERLDGEDGARLAAASHCAAIDAVGDIVAHEGIECDFARLDGYLFVPPEDDDEELVREYGAALRAGVEGLEWVDRAPIAALETGRCLRFPRQGQLHPLKYLNGLARALQRNGCTVYTGTRAVEIEDGPAPWVRTGAGHRIDCEAVVVATNTPFNDRFAIQARQVPHTTYVVAMRVPKGTVANALFWDTLDAPHDVRLNGIDGELLIVGGEGHAPTGDGEAQPCWDALELWARERFPTAREIVHRWSGRVMETVDGLAYIGRNPGHRNVYVATGDSGMGMTHGTIAGIVLADLINGVSVPWTNLYDPTRVDRLPLAA